MWLYLFQFEKYYKNHYTLKNLQFFKNNKGIKKDIKYFRNFAAFNLKIPIKSATIINPSKELINNAFLYSKNIKHLGKDTINKRMLTIIKENEIMKKSKSYPYYKKIT